MAIRFARIVSLALVGAGFVVAYATVISRLIGNWVADDNYSHAFLIVPVVLYLVWQRRERLRAAPVRPSLAGLLLLAGSLGLLAAGTLGAELFVTRVSLPAAVAGAVLFIWGPRHLAILAFPLALLLLAIPLPSILFNHVTFPLQLVASRLGEAVLWAAGIPVLREGNIITLAHARLEVAEACSGIRSLMSLLALAILYGYFTDTRLRVRLVLALVAVPVAILVNGLRIAGTGMLASAFGIATAEGFFHGFSGWLMFVVAFALLVGVHRVLVALWPEPAPQPPALLPTES